MANNERLKRMDLDYGKVPPQAVDLEEAVLGAIMLERGAYDKVCDYLRKDSFYKDSHQKIFNSIQSLSMRNDPVDILTVTQELKRLGELDDVGGGFYISKLTDRVASAAHIEHHAKIIAQKFMKREMIRISSEIMAKAFDESIDVAELFEDAEKMSMAVTEGITFEKGTFTFLECLNEAYDARVEREKRSAEGLKSGVTTGLRRLDKILGGWQKTDLIILGARPSMGKSALAMFFARVAAKNGHRTAFFELEMSRLQLTDRNISSYGINSENMRDGKMTDEEKVLYDKFINDHSNIDLHVDDTAGATISYVMRTCRRLHKIKPLELIVIDYLQLIKHFAAGRSRENEVSEISRSLKMIAKELNCPVLALSQLSRKLEDRAGDAKIPGLADLRESGAIEQDADIVLFMYRPWVYGINEDADGNRVEKGDGLIRIAKHRNGGLGDIPFQANDTLSDFYDKGDAPADIPEDYNPNAGIEPSNSFDKNDFSDEIPKRKTDPIDGTTDELPF